MEVPDDTFGLLVPDNHDFISFKKDLFPHTLQTPLHDAAIRGSLEEIKSLIENGEDVNVVDEFGFTPLHLVINHMPWSKGKSIGKFLIETGADVNTTGQDGVSPLQMALKHGVISQLMASLDNDNLEVIQMLIDAGANVNHKDECDNTPLHVACKQGYMQAFELLVKHGADLQAKTKSQETLLHLTQNPKIAEVLLTKGFDIMALDEDMRTPLHHAVSNGCKDMVSFLIEKGFNVSAADKDGETPLHLAVENNRHDLIDILFKNGAKVAPYDQYNILVTAVNEGFLDVVKTLIKHGLTANTHGQNNSLRTQLHWARDSRMAEILLENGADVTAKDAFGVTPLIEAAMFEREDVVHILIKHGANVGDRNNFNETSLHVTNDSRIAEILIQNGADVNAKDEFGNTPLHNAASSGIFELAKILIEHGANVCAEDESSETALHLTTNLKIANILIRNGADIMAKDDLGSTPLHYAAGDNDLRKSKLLLDNGANINEVNTFGTPLQNAVKKGHKEILKFLIKKGADVNARRWPFDAPLYCAITENQSELLQLLIFHGAKIDEKSLDGASPLHKAVQEKSLETIPILLKCWVSARVKDKDRYNPLELALKTKNCPAFQTICCNM